MKKKISVHYKFTFLVLFLIACLITKAQEQHNYQSFKAEKIDAKYNQYVIYTGKKGVGLMDMNTKKFIIQPEYSTLVEYNGFLKASLPLPNSYGMYGILNFEGKEIIPIKFQEIYISEKIITTIGKFIKMDNSMPDYPFPDFNDSIFYFDKNTFQLIGSISRSQIQKDWQLSDSTFVEIKYNPIFQGDDTLAIATSEGFEKVCVYSISGKRLCLNQYAKIEREDGSTWQTLDSTLNIIQGKIALKTQHDTTFINFQKQKISTKPIDEYVIKNQVEAKEIASQLYQISSYNYGGNLIESGNFICDVNLNIPLKEKNEKRNLRSLSGAELDNEKNLPIIPLDPFVENGGVIEYHKTNLFTENFLLVGSRMNHQERPTQLDLWNGNLTKTLKQMPSFENADSVERIKGAKYMWALTHQYKYGFIDLAGNYKIKQQYFSAYPFHEGLACVSNDSIGFHFINTKGEVAFVCPSNFSSLLNNNQVQEGPVFYEGLCHFKTNVETFGYLNKVGKIAFELPDSIVYAGHFSDGLAVVVNKRDKIGFINQKGQLVIPFKYNKPFIFDESQKFENKVFLVQTTKNQLSTDDEPTIINENGTSEQTSEQATEEIIYEIKESNGEGADFGYIDVNGFEYFDK